MTNTTPTDFAQRIWMVCGGLATPLIKTSPTALDRRPLPGHHLLTYQTNAYGVWVYRRFLGLTLKRHFRFARRYPKFLFVRQGELAWNCNLGQRLKVWSWHQINTLCFAFPLAVVLMMTSSVSPHHQIKLPNSKNRPAVALDRSTALADNKLETQHPQEAHTTIIVTKPQIDMKAAHRAFIRGDFTTAIQHLKPHQNSKSHPQVADLLAETYYAIAAHHLARNAPAPALANAAAAYRVKPSHARSEAIITKLIASAKNIFMAGYIAERADPEMARERYLEVKRLLAGVKNEARWGQLWLRATERLRQLKP